MRFLAFLLCLSPLAVTAQDRGGRTCRVLFLGGGTNDAETLHLHDGAGTREVELPRMNLSKEYALPSGALTLRLFATPPVPDKPLDPMAPAAAVAETTGDFYLLVMSDPAGGKVPAVRMQIIDASNERFKSGQMLWYNLTPHDVGGQVGSQKLVIKGASRQLLDAPASGNEDYNVNLSFRIAGKEALYPLCETRWIHDPSARMLLFIINEPGVRTPRVMGFPDHRTPRG
jgi:hypothetical protein